jgi:hypothetical protein
MAREHRKLRFNSIDEAMAEAERLAVCETRTTGHFSLGQIYEHLARTFEVVLGEREMPPTSFPMRTMARLMRPMVLRKASTGFKLPAKAQDVLWPSEDVTVEEGLAHLRETFGRFKSAPKLPKHVFFGNMTRLQHDTLQCRHFESHLGFVHPV